MIVANSDLSYLIPKLRLHIGDLDGSRFIDDWLNVALIAAFDTLQNWWNYKYIPSTVYSGNIILEYTVERNPDRVFVYPQDKSVIEPGDERAIILMASIMILSGYLENNAWSLGSWKDYEISVSNIEGSRALREKIKNMYEELSMLYNPPSRKLTSSKRRSLPGYIGNILEYGDPTDF